MRLILNLLIILSLYTLKNLYDLIDFKINQYYYITLLRNKHSVQPKQKKFKQELIKCPKCEYICKSIYLNIVKSLSLFKNVDFTFF